MGTLGRRPIKSRGAAWAKWLAERLCQIGVMPNAISVASVFFALGGTACLLWLQQSWRPLLCPLVAGCILLRLLCNLLDGMVAVEGGKQGALGDLFNEFPDRFSDVLLIAPLGYLCPELPYAVALGWSAALLALATAYVRAFSAAQGFICFAGPMAKSHRMALEVAGLLAAALLTSQGIQQQVIYLTLIIMVVGCLLTLWRRTGRLVRHLQTGGER